jgi:2-polyprenyl-3-methyl-5-hydroxy-6-metoxy-1,4-benzoquinol methylase
LVTGISKKDRPYLELCPVGCTSPLVSTDIVLPEGPLQRCSDCGQLLSQCSEEHYRQSLSEFDDPQGTLPGPDSLARHHRRAEKCLKKISRALGKSPREIRLLDIGCSTGSFMAVAREKGFTAEGVEPAPRAAQAALKAGLLVHQGFLEDIAFPDQTFDVVTLFEVIEHVRDAVSLVRECRRILHPGGILVLGTGNTESWAVSFMQSRWEYFHIARHGGHISFFNPRSIRLLAERSGFQVFSIKTSSMRFFEKGEVHPFLYRLAKGVSELLNVPAQVFHKGHDMQIFLQRP